MNRISGARMLVRSPESYARNGVTLLPTDQPGVVVVRLYDPIDSWGGEWGVSAKEFAAAIDSIPAGTNEVRLHLNSPGGDVFEGITIANLLRGTPARVVAVVDGLAASAASFIASAADEVVMGRNAELMIHDAWGLGIGNAADMRDLADRLDHLSNNIASIYAEKAGGSVDVWRSAMLAETWYSADEAVAAGLADRVSPAQAPDDPKARFDLSAFRHQGRAQAPAPAPRPVNSTHGGTFAVGDRVEVTIDPPHAPGQQTGTVAEVGGTAYGIVFDQMPEAGIHRWYTAAEIEPFDAADAADPADPSLPDPGVPMDPETDPMMVAALDVRHRHNARRLATT